MGAVRSTARGVQPCGSSKPSDCLLSWKATSKLAFNFAALQLYEILLVFVAIVLGVRRVWYDSTLLVVLENLLLLVPFILVTQAILIGKGLAADIVAIETTGTGGHTRLQICPMPQK